MVHNFRLYEKKRGGRRTGAGSLGTAGEAVFFAVFLLIGCGVLVALFATLVIPQWRVNHEFTEGTCTVKNTRVAAINNKEGVLYRPEIEIEYHVEGERYRKWTYDIATARDLRSSYSSDEQRQRAVIDSFKRDESRPCWYDPNDPNVAVLVRGYSWWVWLVFVVPVSFIVIGLGGFLCSVLHWGKSAEHRAALAQQASEYESFEFNGRRRPKFPNVPDDTDVANNPGNTLEFRLPIGTSPGWALFGMLLACLFWNGIVSIFVVLAVGAHLDGNPDWLMTLFIIPFVLVGIVLIVIFIRRLLVTTGIGPTLVEISAHPLHPSDQCRLFISQPGRLTFNAIEVLLVCEEKATYRQGTNTRTETREVYQQEILRCEDFEVHRGLPFETQCELAVPAAAMHSFRSEHNEVNWTVVVKGDVAGWPDYRRAFPVVVQPANGSTGT